MIKIGLTGNRFSGKSTVSKMFKQMHVPVFEADVVFKFLINHDINIKDKIKERFGESAYDMRDLFVAAKIKKDEDFNSLIEIAEFEMRKAFEKFRMQNKESLYAVFTSSILFESGWNVFMDYSISVYCPKKERINRGSSISAIQISKIKEMLKNEMDEITKNGLADYVVHNYETGSGADTIEQIVKIDQKIIDRIFSEKYKTAKI